MTLPKKAYYHALKYGPSDETREIACKIPFFTYYYAKDVDKVSIPIGKSTKIDKEKEQGPTF